MKAICVCSHRETGDEGKYKDYVSGEVYEFPDGEELGPNFAPYIAPPTPGPRPPAPKKKEVK